MRRLQKNFLRALILPLAALAAAAYFAPAAPPVASAAGRPGLAAESSDNGQGPICEAKNRRNQSDWMKTVVRGAMRLLAETS